MIWNIGSRIQYPRPVDSRLNKMFGYRGQRSYRRQLPTPHTSVPFQTIPRSISLVELRAFRKRIANTHLGNSICAEANTNNDRMRRALGTAGHTLHSLPESMADSVNNNVMTPHSQSGARAGGNVVVMTILKLCQFSLFSALHAWWSPRWWLLSMHWRHGASGEQVRLQWTDVQMIVNDFLHRLKSTSGAMMMVQSS